MIFENKDSSSMPSSNEQEFLHTVSWQEGWLQVKVPVPFSLKWVNSYLIPEEQGYTLIDPGLRTDEAIQVWDKVLQHHNLEWRNVTRIILTHQHPDHYGLAGYVQERSGAPVFISRRAHDYAIRLWGEKVSSASSYRLYMRSMVCRFSIERLLRKILKPLWRWYPLSQR